MGEEKGWPRRSHKIRRSPTKRLRQGDIFEFDGGGERVRAFLYEAELFKKPDGEGIIVLKADIISRTLRPAR